MAAINRQKPGRDALGFGPSDDIPRDFIEALSLGVNGQHLLRLPGHFERI